MRTADFLPPKAFRSHMERRRTPRRVAILAVFGLFGLSGAISVEVEARVQEERLEMARMPDSLAKQAQEDLERICGEMTRYSSCLDPLTDHLRLPTIGWILAGLAAEAGPGVKLEKIVFEHEALPKRQPGSPDRIVTLEVTSTLDGDDTVLQLPDRLRQFTGFDSVETVSSEVIRDRPDALRVVIRLTAPLGLAPAQAPTGSDP